MALLSAVAFFGVVLQMAPSEANHANSITGVFESNDGNLDVDHAGTTDAVDWNSFTVAGTASAWNFQKFNDNIGNPDDIFSGGTKQDANCPGTKPAGSLGGGSGKIDLSRIYLAHKNIGGTDYLFVAWGRVDGSDAASSHVAYEFNRGTVACSNNNGLVNRVEGDVLLVYDFSGGDADAQLKVLRWKTSAGTCEVANHTPPCWAVVPGVVADGEVNAGVSVDDDIKGDTLGPVQFGEAAVNLNSAGIDPCELNGTVTGVSRSSGDSGTAQMKDKVGPGAFSLPGCTQATSITTKVRMTDTATIQGFDSTFVGDHSGTLTFSLYGPDDTDCDGTPVFTSVHSNVATANHVASGFYEATATGTYNWVVDYSGDSANDASFSECGDEAVAITYGF